MNLLSKRLNTLKNSDEKNSIRLILLFSVAFNVIAFLTVIAVCPPVWYTNDDYRMMTIVSGAYTGTPSADIVFMRYPVGLMLSGLYSLTTQIPWYGLFTMLCMFVPSCIFCYYIVKKAYLKNYTVLGAVLYALLFVFLIRKYICLPQFTLTSAFMGTGAIVLFHEMPADKNIKQIILAVICSVVAFSVRSKAFYMLLPLIGLIILVRIINEKGTKIWKPFTAVCLAALVLCGCVYAVDYAAWNRSEDYQDFKRFNTARSEVYDYIGVPNYYDNMPFYVENGIDEVTYRALAARYLDIDDSVDAQTLETIADYTKDIRTSSGSVFDRIKIAFEENIEYWFDSGDEIVKYSSIFVFVLLGISLILSLRKKKQNIIFPLAVAGFILESVYLEFSGRLVVRIVDTLLLALGVVGCLTIINLLEMRNKTVREYFTLFSKNKINLLSAGLVALSVAAVVFSSVISLNTALKDKYYSATVTQNSRLDSLKSYAKRYPDSFFFYDTNNFISSTDYVFKTYDEGEILNHDSLGSWNVCSPTYYERNEHFGFTSSADGLTNEDGNVYLVTTTAPKMGITKTLKDKYNKKLRMVETVDADNFILYIYMVVDDD